MNYEAVATRYPLNPDIYNLYLIRSTKPPLNTTKLDTRFCYGLQRQVKTPTTGDLSLVLSYKGKEGAVSSFGINDRDLTILQIQGAKSSESYRVSTGIHWGDFMADEAIEIAKHPESGVKRVCMPNPLEIKGLIEAESELAMVRYQYFIARALLRWSELDKAFVRDLI